MKKTICVLLTILMLGCSIIWIPTSAFGTGNDEMPTWHGSAIEPEGRGTKEDPYLFSSAGNLQWLVSQFFNGDQILRTLGYRKEIWYADYDSKTEALYWDYTINSEKVNTLATLEAYPKTLYYDSFSTMPYIYIRQVCDIDLEGGSLKSLASYWPYGGVKSGGTAVKGQWFFGHYDGQGYSIKNGSITHAGTNANWSSGFFGNLWGATIENLVFDNIHVSGNGCVGIVAARSLMPSDLGGRTDLFSACRSVIRNVEVKDTCTVTQNKVHSTQVYVGGIIGRAYNTIIENCTNSADITVGVNAVSVGGIAGVMSQGSRVVGCTNNGNIQCQSGVLLRTNAYGGIVGEWTAMDATTFQGVGEIRNCLNTGSLTASSTSEEYGLFYGGVLGWAHGLPTVSGTEYAFVNNISIGETANLSESVSSHCAASLIGNMELNSSVALKPKNCYSSNDFVSVASEAYNSPSLPFVGCKNGTVSFSDACQSLTLHDLELLPLYENLEKGTSHRGLTHHLLGVQTRKNEDGTYSIRFVGGVTSSMLDALSYSLMVTSSGSTKETVTQTNAYTAFLANGETVKASDLGYDYVSLLVKDDLKANTTYTFGLELSATNRFGTREYTQGSNMVAMRFYNGTITYLNTSNRSVKIDGVNIGKFQIVVPSENYRYEFYVAQALVERIKKLTGIELPVVKDSEVQTTHEIRIGQTNRGTSLTVADGQYAVIPTEGCLELLFSGWVATNELIDALTDIYFPDHAYAVDLVLSGSRVSIQKANPYYGNLTAYKQVAVSTPYIDKLSANDIRIMYYNIWGYTHANHNSSIELLCDLFKTYDPDILGLQECKGLEDAVNWLKANGYTMVRFDKNNGYKNNNGQGNPIFFKTGKFQLVSSGYACARNGDKGTTWVVLKEIATGKTFGLTNSHFCANSNAKNHDGLGTQYRNEDVQAMLDAIQKHILTNPNVEAIITGGDYNTTTTKKVTYNGVTYFPYQTLLDGGFRNIRDIVPDHEESLFGTHNAGATYNKEWNVLNLETFRKHPLANAIDQVMYYAPMGNALTAKRYYLLHDRLTCTTSDHLPQMFDFAWK